MKPMKNSIAFESLKGNRYFCARDKRQILLCHPVFFHLIDLHEKGTDLEDWIRNLPENSIEIGDAGPFSKKNVEYYYRKFLLLQDHGYFAPFDFNKQFNLKLEPQYIQNILANATHVVFEVTDSCNLRCEYCGYGKFYSDYEERRNINIDPEAAKRLLAFLEKGWNSHQNVSMGRRINIGFYGGEPLLNFPFINDMVDYIKKLEVPRGFFTFTMTTNALLLSKYMDFLYENQFWLLISLDGSPKNNSYRVFPDGSESYEHVLRNVFALKEKYPEYFKEKVNFNTVFHNRSSLEEIYKHFKTNFDKIPMINELTTVGIDPSKKEEFWATYASTHEDFLRIENPRPMIDNMLRDLPMANSISSFIHYFSDGCYEDYKEVMDTKGESKRFPTGTCFPFHQKIFLTVNNKILPCERIGHQHTLGAVTPEGVELDMDRITGVYNDHYGKIAELCRNCYMPDNCKQCMLQMELEDDVVFCDGFMTMDDRKNHFVRNFDYLEEYPKISGKIVKEVIRE
ncbi:radical SAM peptide maturase [Thermodesulfobacteriota bacterium]